MIPEFGLFALLVAAVLGAVPWIALVAARRAAARSTGPDALFGAAARGQALALALSVLSLAASLASDDFSVAYVTRESNAALPLAWKLAALAAHPAGVALLLALSLAAAAAILDVASRRSVAILRGCGAGATAIAVVLAALAQPFAREWPPAADGSGASMATWFGAGGAWSDALASVAPLLPPAIVVVATGLAVGLGWSLGARAPRAGSPRAEAVPATAPDDTPRRADRRSSRGAAV